MQFTKISATGNDFILIDNRDGRLRGDEHAFFHRICQRRRSVGADGILLIQRSAVSDFSLVYYNSDGYIGEMCGNGARAAAFYAFKHNIAPAAVRFDVLGVEYRAEVRDDWVSLTMPAPVEVREHPGVVEEPDFAEGGYVNVGVPHYVLFVPDVDRVDVERIGRKYRHHAAFQPWGANTNFAQILDDRTMKLRTYERGVEEETLACGTGTVSSAILAVKQRGMRRPITVHAPGGVLQVDFDESISEIKLVGQVAFIYYGELLEKIDSHAP